MMTVPMSISLLAASELHGAGNLEVTITFNDGKLLTGYLWGVTSSSEGVLVQVGSLTNKEYYYVSEVLNCDFNMCYHCDLGGISV